jgi:hypothetical protein
VLADQYSQDRRVDEGRIGQVDHERTALLAQPLELATQGVGVGQVMLTTNGDDCNVAVGRHFDRTAGGHRHPSIVRNRRTRAGLTHLRQTA